MRLTIEQAARSGRPISYEEYLCTPETNRPYEILDGVVTMCPAPLLDHQWVSGEIYEPLKEYVRRNRLGVVLNAPVDVVIAREPRVKTRQPDILFLSRARTGISGRRQLRNLQVIEVTPELVVEVLSPDETGRKYQGKLDDYALIGVPEIWAVRAPGQMIEVLRLEDGAYARSGLYGNGDVIVSPVLPGLNLSVDTIFADEDDEDDADAENVAEAGENREETGADAAQNSA